MLFLYMCKNEKQLKLTNRTFRLQKAIYHGKLSEVILKMQHASCLNVMVVYNVPIMSVHIIIVIKLCLL